MEHPPPGLPALPLRSCASAGLWHRRITPPICNPPNCKALPQSPWLQIVSKKVYLAVPSECPVGPDGKPRKTPQTGVSGRTGAQGLGAEGRGSAAPHRVAVLVHKAQHPVHAVYFLRLRCCNCPAARAQ